jgi:hypothetical protein
MKVNRGEYGVLGCDTVQFGQYDVTTQKAGLSILTAMRTSNLTKYR